MTSCPVPHARSPWSLSLGAFAMGLLAVLLTPEVASAKEALSAPAEASADFQLGYSHGFSDARTQGPVGSGLYGGCAGCVGGGALMLGTFYTAVETPGVGVPLLVLGVGAAAGVPVYYSQVAGPEGIPPELPDEVGPDYLEGYRSGYADGGQRRNLVRSSVGSGIGVLAGGTLTAAAGVLVFAAILNAVNNDLDG